MNILLIGSGGREHTLAWKMAQSKKLDKLYIAPGNAGTAAIGQNVDIKVNDFEGLGKFSIENKIDMVVVGPEDPLAKGIHDYFLDTPELKKIAVIGPQKKVPCLKAAKTSPSSSCSGITFPLPAITVSTKIPWMRG